RKDQPFWDALNANIKNLHAVISGHDHGDEWCAREPTKDVIFVLTSTPDTVGTVAQDGATVYGTSCSPRQILLVGLKRGFGSRADRRGQELHWTEAMVDDLHFGDPPSHTFTRFWTRAVHADPNFRVLKAIANAKITASRANATKSGK
ncbi:hypothetical protein BD769DRAFT_1392961, partial [Suillus cothurnatus]